MNTIFLATEAKSLASKIHHLAQDLPQGEGIVVHKIANVIWDEAQHLEFVAAIGCRCYRVPCRLHRCGHREGEKQCTARRVSDDVPACIAHKALWDEVA